MQLQEHFNLKSYNTFGISKTAKFFAELNETNQFDKIHLLPDFTKKRLILGGGSNILLTNDFDGLVLKNSIKGIEIVKEDETNIWIKSFGGENWHVFVMHCVKNNWGGIENLSLIPGQVGAAPMQNIGAYGVEIKDTFESLEAWNIQKQQFETFKTDACNFGYRESVFKNIKKDEYIIVSVTFKLTKINHQINTSYGAIEEVLKSQSIDNPTLKDVSDAVIFIRQSKLPDPKKIGNSGSFFKNPVVEIQFFNQLQKAYPQIPFYPINESFIKIPAGWLIEKAGWKGKRFNNYGVHKNQALVLVNYGGADGAEIYDLSKKIQADIRAKFDIDLQSEVNII